jgi:hypothetical protein
MENIIVFLYINILKKVMDNKYDDVKGVKLYDIVIPVHSKDFERFKYQIEYTKKNILNYRNIYIVSNITNISIDGCIIIDENIYPFSKKMISNYVIEKSVGWVLQQLIKLYSGFVIPNILENYLVIDSDTFFFKPTTFIENNKLLFAYGTEHHKPYFEQMKRMNTELIKMIPDKSGICHHMIFNTKYVKELFNFICKEGDEFYNVLLKNINKNDASCVSEYEIFFNYMIKFNPDKIKIRKLKWKNYERKDTDLKKLMNEYDYVSFHQYSIKNETLFKILNNK